MTIDTSLDEIKYFAVWFERDECGYMTVERALDEINTGRAKVIAPDEILLLYKMKPFRVRILERDNYTCYFCGEYGNTLEHLHPKSKGGKNTEENCVCACKECNSHKRDMTESEYWIYLKDEYLRKKEEEGMFLEIDRYFSKIS